MARSKGLGPITSWAPGDAAVGRILAAAEPKRGASKPADRDQLINDLLYARSQWLLWSALDSKPGARIRANAFRQLKESAIDLRTQLVADTSGRDDRREFLAREMMLGAFSTPKEFEAFLAGLDRIIEMGSKQQKDNEAGPMVSLDRSPREWFVATVLIPLFEKHFGEAGISRDSDSGRPGGPSVRFLVQVMEEMGIGIGSETVVRVMKDIKAGRKGRRKSR